MNPASCLMERFSALSLGVVFLIGALGSVVVGVTVLPVIGLVVAVPFVLLAAYFFRAHFNKQCEISSP